MAAWTTERLQQFAQSLDPGARLVSPGPLRRQIKESLDLVGPTLLVPHRFGWVVDAKAFEQAGMGVPLPLGCTHALAIARPMAREMQGWREEDGERWARGMVAHLAADRDIAGKDLTEIRTLLGEPAWEEVAGVLREERRVAPHASDHSIALEFLSTWRELEASGAENGPAVWFPAVSRDTIAKWLPAPEVLDQPASKPSAPVEFATTVMPPGLSRLLETTTDAITRDAAVELVALASNPKQSRARALLADVDAALGIEGEVLERVDFFGWLTTLGQVPIRLTMPERGTLLAIRILKRCVRNLGKTGLSPAAEKALEAAIRARLEDIDSRLACQLRQALAGALGESGLGGGNFLERIDSEKIVDELLIRLVDHGSLAISDLRDAVARSRVKLDDLSGLSEFVWGDALLRADRALSRALPGGYRRGEAYNRGLQRFSSLFFGTSWGRLLFLNLILPFAICFVSFKGLQELVHYGLLATFQKQEILSELDQALPDPPPWWLPVDIEDTDHSKRHVSEGDEEFHGHLEVLLGNPAWYATGTLFTVALIRYPAFRRWFARGLWLLGVLLHRLLIDLPGGIARFLSWLIRLPVIRPLFQFALRPALLAWLGLFIINRQERQLGVTFNQLTKISVFSGLFLAFISPAWRRAEEFLMDALAWAWNHLGLALLLAIVDWILALFRKVTDAVSLWLAWMERRLIRKPGGSRAGLLGLAILSIFLSPLVYLLRFGFTVLLEPQVNPVKHFPVVSVGHKIMLLLVPSVAQFVSDRTGWTFDYCLLLVFTVIGLIPGFLGFMVWELKENWRLYRANMPDRLTPVPFGSHGETARGMLVPGFHSGTVPALFRRARHGVAITDELEHARHAIERFIHGSFLSLLEGTKDFPHPELESISLTKASISAGVSVQGRSALLVIRWRGHWLEADWNDKDLRDILKPESRAAWDDARDGLWHLAGAEVLAPPLASATGALAHGAVSGGCWVKTDTGQLQYLWEDAADPLKPEEGRGPILAKGQFLVSARPIPWTQWSARWQERSGGWIGT